MTQIHEIAKWFATLFATLTGWALANSQQLVAVVTSTLSAAALIGSWWIAWRVKFGDARRKERWADAALDWQIEELRKGRIEMPRLTRQSDELPPMPVAPIPPAPDADPPMPMGDSS